MRNQILTLMFKKNEGFRQLDAFAVNSNLSKKKQNLWDNSNESHFFKEVFCKIDESIFSVLYSTKKSRPNTPVNQMVGALILKHLYNWTFQQLFINLNFNILSRYAIGVTSPEEEVFCEASIFNFQNRLIRHLKDTGEDLIEKVFCQLTVEQIKSFGVDTSVQRGDSFLVGSNIINYSRLQLLIEVLKRFVRILDTSDSDSYVKDVSVYTEFSSSNYLYQLSKDVVLEEMKNIGFVYAKLLVGVGDKYLNCDEYINFKRVFEEHFNITNTKQVKLRPGSELHSTTLMSPDDNQATFRKKQKQECKGYVTHISETVNPSNKVNIITDVYTQPNNIGDAEILKDRLPVMIQRTPDINEYFVDGQYGSAEVDEITEREDIKIYQKSSRGRRSSAGIIIQRDESEAVTVSCKGGQSILASITSPKNYKIIFDSKICSQCPYRQECAIPEFGGKTKSKRRVMYFNRKKILVIERKTNIDKLEEKKRYSRANVEATVKETKRGMKNGKVRVRGLMRVSMHMIFTVMGINLRRIRKNKTQKTLFELCDHLLLQLERFTKDKLQNSLISANRILFIKSSS